MRTFEYTSATTVDEALNGQAQAVGTSAGKVQPEPAPVNGTRFLAGGTDLLTLMKADVYAPSLLVDIKRAGDLPRGIEEQAGGLTLGALTTLSEIEHDPRIAQQYPALTE